MGDHLDVREAQAELPRQLRVRDRLRITPKLRLQRIEQVTPPRRAKLVLQSLEDSIQQSSRPTLLEAFGWVGFRRRFTEIARFGILLVEREQPAAPAALLGAG